MISLQTWFPENREPALPLWGADYTHGEVSEVLRFHANVKKNRDDVIASYMMILSSARDGPSEFAGLGKL